MEALYSSPFPTRFPTKLWKKKLPFRYRTTPTFRNPSFPIYLLSCNTKKFQALAHFGGPTTRRNSLRKKLIQENQVNKNSVPLNPISDFQYLNTSIDDYEGKLKYDGIKESELSNGDGDDIIDEMINEKESLSSPKRFGESVLLSKLENWVEQYKRDSEYWGIGSGQIFTVYQDSDGNVERVLVNEDEILRRSKIERRGLEGSPEVNLKILEAESLAREMESGGNVIPRNSTVGKFVVQGEESGVLKTIQGFSVQPDLFPKLSRVGRTLVYVFIAVWVLKKLFTSGKKEEKYTELEKAMMRRKIKSREEKEVLEKGNLEVEVVQESSELPMGSFEKPNLDKEDLMNTIVSAKSSNGKLALQVSLNSVVSKSSDIDVKVEEIRTMARKARGIENMEHSSIGERKTEIQAINDEFADGVKVVVNQHREGADISADFGTGVGVLAEGSGSLLDFVEDGNIQTSNTLYVEVSDDRQSIEHDKDSEQILDLADDAPLSDSEKAESSLIEVKPRIIRSVKEAREYLSKKRDKTQERQIEPVIGSDDFSKLQRDKNENQQLDMANHAKNAGIPDYLPAKNASEAFSLKDKKFDDIKIDKSKEREDKHIAENVQNRQTSLDGEGSGNIPMTEPSVKHENWIEENFDEFEPIVKKIGVGFRDNYMVSRKKEEKESSVDVTKLLSDKEDDESELEWMKDEKLSEIVFQVRENELCGRDPFHMMDAEDKVAFFDGLEKKVETVNKKLSKLHEWIHSNVENIDYGADGVSVYDPPEKIIPRWKGPPLEKSQELLTYFEEQRKEIFTENTGNSYPAKTDDSFLQKPPEPQSHDSISKYSSANHPKEKEKKDSKTVIEGSDGSVRAGKKSGKEFWQHTKKWSQGFVDSYNAETDPEIKSTMKDMGKDLDRWITEKEIQEAADFMTRMPEKSKAFVEKKLNKLKREMELFGPQAVVSKYREYAETKEDYLWWLDLPYVLCIEMYTDDNEEQRIGFYSLEMAADLELEPKPYHVIAFEDSHDCKNFCYIIQAQMELLGNGYAFVLPQPPKDVFRDAKAKGFGVTVIRKGELKLHVDQALEEVEEQITEMGSKIYHDKIMQERSVDISALMKGVFGFSSKPNKRTRPKTIMKEVTGFGGKAPAKRKRSKQMQKKPKQK